MAASAHLHGTLRAEQEAVAPDEILQPEGGGGWVRGGALVLAQHLATLVADAPDPPAASLHADPFVAWCVDVVLELGAVAVVDLAQRLAEGVVAEGVRAVRGNGSHLVVAVSVVTVGGGLYRRDDRVRPGLHVPETVVSVRLRRPLGRRLFESLNAVVEIVVGPDGDDVATPVVGVGP